MLTKLGLKDAMFPTDSFVIMLGHGVYFKRCDMREQL